MKISTYLQNVWAGVQTAVGVVDSSPKLVLMALFIGFLLGFGLADELAQRGGSKLLGWTLGMAVGVWVSGLGERVFHAFN